MPSVVFLEEKHGCKWRSEPPEQANFTNRKSVIKFMAELGGGQAASRRIERFRLSKGWSIAGMHNKIVLRKISINDILHFERL